MAVALLDSNILIAFVSSRDEDHDTAREILTTMDQEELPTGRLTNYVVSEALGYLNEKHGHEVATDLYSRLKSGSGFEVVHCTRADFTTAESIFDRQRQLSFADATVVSYARRTGVEYLYSFDDGFDRADDVTRLNNATNPYR